VGGWETLIAACSFSLSLSPLRLPDPSLLLRAGGYIFLSLLSKEYFSGVDYSKVRSDQESRNLLGRRQNLCPCCNDMILCNCQRLLNYTRTNWDRAWFPTFPTAMGMKWANNLFQISLHPFRVGKTTLKVLFLRDHSKSGGQALPGRYWKWTKALDSQP
jgi:hypothetical protein